MVATVTTATNVSIATTATNASTATTEITGKYLKVDLEKA